MASKYQNLSQEEETETPENSRRYATQTATRARKTIYALSLGLGISVIFNIILILQLYGHNAHLEVRNFAGLERKVSVPIPHDNRTIDDDFWDDPQFDDYVGMVALGDEFTQEKGLLSSQRWPWDHSKGIYVVHGFHSLHCVRLLRETIMEYRDDKPHTWDISHVTHCLHVLHEDILCYADDLPRYTGALHAEAGHHVTSSGTGEIRICRDWDQLRRWAIENSACYKRPSDHYIPLLDRYKFCPDGSEPWKHNQD
ncbi:hypothetical protein PISL3812_03473 [Talaromyces islandicus]|uniref:Oxidase ustYa n=1 Tax=Talaromyces islandicus TaxID=28573 RepID=A0A0U1LST9_TALIS|nr:hypothetical protein PISL3812_03473 [Talaromyces islandicus]